MISPFCKIIKSYESVLGPVRSLNLGPKTVKTGPKTDAGPVFARTDPSLNMTYIVIVKTMRNEIK